MYWYLVCVGKPVKIADGSTVGVWEICCVYSGSPEDACVYVHMNVTPVLPLSAIWSRRI